MTDSTMITSSTFTGALPDGKTILFGPGFQIDIPTADQVSSILDNLPDYESLEFRMTVGASARAFFSKVEMQLILNIGVENTFEINEVDRGYHLVLEALPELQKKLRKKWWNLTFSSFDGTPGSAITTVITIRPREK